jgi:phage/plasmid-like protein (TIGR03299 family)
MSHEIETREDGTALAVFNRTPAWHTLGTVVDNPDLGLAEAMDLAGLSGWNVRKVPLVGFDGDDAIDSARWSMTVRDNINDPAAPAQELGIVSTTEYTVFQNEEAFAFAEQIMDAGLVVEAGGSLYNGRQPFMLFRTPESIKIGGEDEVFPYIHMTTSHDASLAVTTNLTGIRVVCANTQAMALAEATPRYKVSHLGYDVTLADKVADAREVLGMTFDGITAFQLEAEMMLDRELSAKEFDKIVEGLFPESKSDWAGAETVLTAKRDQYRELYETASTQANIRGTQWAALQAAWEMDEWGKAEDTDATAWAKRSVGRDRDRQGIARTIQTILV